MFHIELPTVVHHRVRGPLVTPTHSLNTLTRAIAIFIIVDVCMDDNRTRHRETMGLAKRRVEVTNEWQELVMH